MEKLFLEVSGSNEVARLLGLVFVVVVAALIVRAFKSKGK